MKAELSRHATICVTPATCDKLNLFLDYLNSLRARNIETTLFVLPSENAVTYYGWSGSSEICREASVKKINCLDLFPRLAAHYKIPGANAYYLDGAHLSVTGSAMVAQWISTELDMKDNVSIQCVFQTKSATDSRRKLPPIPAEACH